MLRKRAKAKSTNGIASRLKLLVTQDKNLFKHFFFTNEFHFLSQIYAYPQLSTPLQLFGTHGNSSTGSLPNGYVSKILDAFVLFIKHICPSCEMQWLATQGNA